MATLKNITINVTASTANFTVTAGNMSDFAVGDLLFVRDPVKGTLAHQVLTKNDSAKTGTFAPNYIGTTQTGLYAMVVPVSTIDPTVDTVIKTELITRITEALAADQRQSANYEQIFSIATGDVEVVLVDGSKVKGPTWRSLQSSTLQLDKANQVVLQGVKFKASIILEDTAAKPANFDCGGYSTFRKSATFMDTVQAPGGIVVNGGNDAPVAIECRRYSTATSGSIPGGTILASSKTGSQTQAMSMSMRHDIGTANYGYISYMDLLGRWHEVRWQDSGDVNNVTGGWVTGSDRRIKDFVEVVEDPIALIRGLELYTFERDGKPSIGGIAQEIEKTMPLLVNEGGSLELRNGSTVDRVKSVDYGTIGYVAVAALNKALDRIDALEERLAALESK